MARNRMKPNGVKPEIEKPVDSKIKSDFLSALEHGMETCTPDFARAIGVKASTLRAWKSKKDKPTNQQKETTLAEATKLGWKPAEAHA